MDLIHRRVWRKGAWVCDCRNFCNGSPIRFSGGIGWHHYEHITMREKLGPDFAVDYRGYRIWPAELGLSAA